MNKDLKSQIILGIVVLIVSFAITIQFRSVSENKATQSVENLRVNELLAELNKERKVNDGLEKQLEAYENDIAHYREAAESTDGYSKVLSEQLTRAEVMAGMVDVKGQGVTVTLNDVQNRSSEGGILNANATLIHDEDIRKVINELFAAGAEVVAVNDSRIISSSAVRCVGPSILINDTKMTPPYVIKAIGKAEQLETALNLTGGVIDNLEIWGFEIDIQKHEELYIPKYTGDMTYDVAMPIKNSEEEAQ